MFYLLVHMTNVESGDPLKGKFQQIPMGDLPRYNVLVREKEKKKKLIIVTDFD